MAGEKRRDARILRRLPDGRYEVQIGRRIHWMNLYRCVQCNSIGSGPDFEHGRGKVGMCSQCASEYDAIRRKAANEKLEVEFGHIFTRERRQRAILIAAEARKLREMRVAMATPPWADRDKIAAIYAESRRRTKEDGIQYHVDHIWPLVHNDCCGLHVHWNLRVITATENVKKGNSLVDGRPRSRRKI